MWAVTRLAQSVFLFFFFNDTAPTEIYTLSLHDALPICCVLAIASEDESVEVFGTRHSALNLREIGEHTSELQSQSNLVCRLLLEKKKNKRTPHPAQCLDRNRTTDRTPAQSTLHSVASHH